ncbi:probable protein phosphatase 2C 8 [Musa acuminata AAA Group]|uniref:probable protein phosphatase 2C 8 n=1 Tax=Musa acuminata AAA Group TaxID=214697 RepID=UPI0031D10511
MTGVSIFLNRWLLCHLSHRDYLLKPYVSSDPELTVTGRTEKDEFLILASDGLWDVISSEMACRVIGKCLEVLASDGYPCGVSNSAAKEAAAVLVRLAISRGSVDNISVVVVKF